MAAGQPFRPLVGGRRQPRSSLRPTLHGHSTDMEGSAPATRRPPADITRQRPADMGRHPPADARRRARIGLEIWSQRPTANLNCPRPAAARVDLDRWQPYGTGNLKPGPAGPGAGVLTTRIAGQVYRFRFRGFMYRDSGIGMRNQRMDSGTLDLWTPIVRFIDSDNSTARTRKPRLPAPEHRRGGLPFCKPEAREPALQRLGTGPRSGSLRPGPVGRPRPTSASGPEAGRDY